jgi:hypothetical protein
VLQARIAEFAPQTRARQEEIQMKSRAPVWARGKAWLLVMTVAVVLALVSVLGFAVWSDPGLAAQTPSQGGQPPQPVSAEGTRATADAYLKSLGMQDEFVFLETYEATVYGTATPDGQEQRWVVDMGARYQTLLNGVPLVGPGSKVSMAVGPDGTVVEFCHFAQKASLAQEKVTIRSVEEALADLESGKGATPPDLNLEQTKNMSVETVDLCYYAPPAGSAEKYYKPVYVFHIRMSDGTLGEWLLSAFEGSTLDGAI